MDRRFRNPGPILPQKGPTNLPNRREHTQPKISLILLGKEVRKRPGKSKRQDRTNKQKDGLLTKCKSQARGSIERAESIKERDEGNYYIHA